MSGLDYNLCDGNPATKFCPEHETQTLSSLCYYLDHGQDNLIEALQYLKGTYKRRREAIDKGLE